MFDNDPVPYDIDRPVNPPYGWGFCAVATCGVWLHKVHPTGYCRAHRAERDAAKDEQK